METLPMTLWRPETKNEKRSARRLRRRARYWANNWKLHPTAPTPYEEWSDVKESYREDVTTALAGHPDIRLSYRQDGRRPPHPIEIEDLALALYAVVCVGGKGISYGQLGCCLRRWGRAYHRAKAARLFALLTRFGLIVKTGPHYRGSHGTRYGRPQRTPEEMEKQTQELFESLDRQLDRRRAKG